MFVYVGRRGLLWAGAVFVRLFITRCSVILEGLGDRMVVAGRRNMGLVPFTSLLGFALCVCGWEAALTKGEVADAGSAGFHGDFGCQRPR